VQLLPEDRILVASYFSIRLYDTSSIEVVANIPPADPPTWLHPSPTWEHHYARSLGISQPYFCSNTNEFRLIFCTKYAVNGFIIPPRSGEESQPKILELMDLNTSFRDTKSCIGYNSAVVIDRVPRLKMRYYSWPESSESSLGLSNSLVGEFDENWRMPEYFAFDECSGRAVVEAGNEVVVYDFAN
jgi:hypothetical protein